jgi:hypothetical protein
MRTPFALRDLASHGKRSQNVHRIALRVTALLFVAEPCPWFRPGPALGLIGQMGERNTVVMSRVTVATAEPTRAAHHSPSRLMRA